jgi:hypothetical protein
MILLCDRDWTVVITALSGNELQNGMNGIRTLLRQLKESISKQ